MRHFILPFGVALLTFGLGIISASIWYMQRQSPIKQMENVARQPAKINDNSRAELLDNECDAAYEGRYSKSLQPIVRLQN